MIASDAIELERMLGEDLRRSLGEPHRVELEDAHPDTDGNARVDRQAIVDRHVGELAVRHGETDQLLGGLLGSAPRRRG